MQKKNYGDTNKYHCFNVVAGDIHVEEFLSATRYNLSSCRHRFRGTLATCRGRELTQSDPVWCYESIL